MNPRAHSGLRLAGALLLACAALAPLALAARSRAPVKAAPRSAAPAAARVAVGAAPHVSSAPMAATHGFATRVATVPEAAPGATRAKATHAAPTLAIAASARTTAPGTAGMIVGRDPETGQLGMPTPGQVQELGLSQDPAVSRSTVGLTEIHLANGAVGLDLQGRFRDYVTVTIGPDGRRTFGCMHDNGDMPHGPAIPPAGLEEK